MQNSRIIDFSGLDLIDWQPVSNSAAISKILRIVEPLAVVESAFSRRLSRPVPQFLEWRLAPAQHEGAITPQLLYRTADGNLFNSFLSVISQGLTGSISDVDIVARMFTPNARHPSMRYTYQGWLIARMDDTDSPGCYMAAVYCNRADDSDVGSIWRYGPSSRNELAASPIGRRIDWDKPWHCRFNIVGGELKAKWWNYDVIEPDRWDLFSIDNIPREPGMIGFASTVHGGLAGNIWGLDWYAWSLDAAVPAPLYPIEAET
jgi:hypothetical protein